MQTGLRFSPAAFFYGLLPPIVFAAGFTLKKRDFFRNFGTISVFAVPGTFISALFFGSITYAMVAIGVVKRSHLGTAPLIECLLYGQCCTVILIAQFIGCLQPWMSRVKNLWCISYIHGM